MILDLAEGSAVSDPPVCDLPIEDNGSVVDPLQPALDVITARRLSGIDDMGAEMRARVAELGAIPLDSPARQEAFAELITALTPDGFDLFLMPDSCRVDPVGHVIHLTGVFVDSARRQVVGTIIRHLELDVGRVTHEWMKVESPYRGAGLAILLLDRSFAFYERMGIRYVAAHAALETGRWYWARLGFDFDNVTEQALVTVWGALALEALGEPPIPVDSRARRWAQLGSGEPPRLVSLSELQAALEASVQAKLLDPQHASSYQQLELVMSNRLGAAWLDLGRFETCAQLNSIAIDAPIPLGRAIMLTGPDWHGVFDLRDSAAREAFDEELSRTLKKLATRGE